MNKIAVIILIVLASLCPTLAAQEDNQASPSVTPADTSVIAPKKEKKFHITALPFVSFDRSKGTGFGAMGMAFFKFDNRPQTKPSSILLFGKYTTKKNWNTAAMASLYFGGDRFRLTTGGSYMNFNFQTYEMIDQANIEVPYNNHGIDAALGRNDWGLYFRIAEAF